MRWFYAWVLGVSALTICGEPFFADSTTEAAKKRTSSSKKHPRRLHTRTAALRPTPPVPAQTDAPPHPAHFEPAPAGEVAVYWAQPQRPRSGVKIRAIPSQQAETLGEMRSDTAAAVKATALAHRHTAGDKGGCRAWLEVVPAGYLCHDEVELRPGYLSDPPPQEKATRWQRFRYGIIKVASAVLERPTGQPAPNAGYLRSILHRGDGVTVVRELADRVQVYGQKWLRKMDVALATPPALSPVNLQAMPPAQRFLVAWAVPPPGETQVALYPLGTSAQGGGPGHMAGRAQPIFVPRYSQLFWADGKASPGRMLVYLSDETRATLGTREGTQAAAQAAAFEIEATELRRVTPAPTPAGLQEGDRWIDISLSEQVAVAYLFDTPLFAALVSTGKSSTPPGAFSIYRKYLTQTMANMSGAASQYDFREVPYAQFFNGRIGLHAVLWHDLLGHPVSHGCVNLSPAAAEQFFNFTKPELPPGWHTVNGISAKTPFDYFRGTRVVVRR